VISEARAALTGLLEDAGFRVFDYVPPNITPPCAVIFPLGDWITPGENFGEYRIGFSVRIFAQALTNQNVTATMDGYVEDVIDAVDSAAGFYMSGMQAPEQFGENASAFLGVDAAIYQITRQ
jgi:hypothetical protein